MTAGLKSGAAAPRSEAGGPPPRPPRTTHPGESKHMTAGLKSGAAAPSSEAGASQPPLRFVSAASLFDGHDAAINMIRRLLQARGAEVVHLGHNRSVADIVPAALDEDAAAAGV